MAARAAVKGLRHFTLGAGVMIGCDMATEVAIKCPPLYDTVLNGAAHAIDCTMQHPAVLIRSFALRQKGLVGKLPPALALGSQAAALYLTSSYGADLTGRLARWRWIKGETEEMPLLSRKRQPLPAPSFAIRTPRDTESYYVRNLSGIGAGAAYLPADHPLTREAERLRDIHLLAMEALIVEQHSANSAVAAAFRANVRSRPIPIRVYKCGSPRMAGFTDGNCIAIRDTAVTPHSETIPHELAHFVLRHVSELQLLRRQELAAAKQQSSPVFGVIWTALLGTASCLPALNRLPLGGTHGCLVLGALRMYHAAFDPATGSGVAPHPGQSKLLWRTVLIELEADRLAVLSMAQAGYDPCPAILERLFTPGSRVGSWQDMQVSLTHHAACDPAALTTLNASDGIGIGGLLWPNSEKQAQNFAQVLPEAMALLDRQRALEAARAKPRSEQEDAASHAAGWISAIMWGCTASAVLDALRRH